MGFAATDLELWSGGGWNVLPEKPLSGFANDTRRLNPGDVFIALKTDRRDGHDFLEDAKKSGAVAALVSEFRDEVDIAQLKVDDVLAGFQRIAHCYRQRFPGPVIGVTGSCGKTTCKDLIATLLGGASSTLSTDGNLNNFLGVPLTLMRGDLQADRFSVVEAGISERNEMDILAKMIEPEIAVITSVGPAHLEGLIDVKTVAAEKLKLGLGDRTRSIFIDETAARHISKVEGKDVYSVRADERLESIGSYRMDTVDGVNELELRFAHGVEMFFLKNASASLASNTSLSLLVASSLGVSVEQMQSRLKDWSPSGMRGEWMGIGDKRVYLDCYNANPLSMLDSLETFNKASAPEVARLYIIGCMEELGDKAGQWHEDLGTKLILRDQDRLCIVGQFADDVLRGVINSGNAKIAQSMQELKTIVAEFTGDVFLKGSRRYQLENALDDALENARKEIS